MVVGRCESADRPPYGSMFGLHCSDLARNLHQIWALEHCKFFAGNNIGGGEERLKPLLRADKLVHIAEGIDSIGEAERARQGFGTILS